MKTVIYEIEFMEKKLTKFRLSKAIFCVEKKIIKYLKLNNLFDDYSSIRYQLIYNNDRCSNGKRFSVPDLKVHLLNPRVSSIEFYVIMQNQVECHLNIKLRKIDRHENKLIPNPNQIPFNNNEIIDTLREYYVTNTSDIYTTSYTTDSVTIDTRSYNFSYNEYQ